MDYYTLCAYIGAYFIIIVASFPIKATYVKMWESYGEFEKRTDIFSGIVGNMERIIYVTAITQGSLEVVAVWLGLKTATQWKRWADENLKAQGAYNVFLVGNGLSVLFSMAGSSLVILYKEKFSIEWYAILIIGIFISLCGFWLWLHRKIKLYGDSDDAFWKKQIKKGMKKKDVLKSKYQHQIKKSEIIDGVECLHYEYSVPGKCYKQTIRIKDDVVVESEIQSE